MIWQSKQDKIALAIVIVCVAWLLGSILGELLVCVTGLDTKSKCTATFSQPPLYGPERPPERLKPHPSTITCDEPRSQSPRSEA